MPIHDGRPPGPLEVWCGGKGVFEFQISISCVYGVKEVLFYLVVLNFGSFVFRK